MDLNLTAAENDIHFIIHRMRLIRKAQVDADAVRKKAKKDRHAYDRDCRKTGSGRNACAPPPDFVPEDGNFS